MSESRDRMLALVLATSSLSLMILGGASLIISLFGLSLVGCLISLAIASHGSFEFIWFRKWRAAPTHSIRKRLALNQIALAASISLYAAWNALTVNVAEIQAMLMRPPITVVLDMYPADLRIRLIENTPEIVRALYYLVILVAWLGCGATALFYWLRAGSVLKRSEAR